MKYILLSLLALSLTACIDSDDDDPYAAVKLNELTVTGTNNIEANSSNGETAVIKYSDGAGSFNVSFKGKFNSGAHVEIFLSNSKTGTSSSNKFFGLNCGGSISAVSNCKNSYSTKCVVSQNGIFSCEDSSENPNLLSYINANNSLFLVAQACNVLSDECSKQSIPVKFE